MNRTPSITETMIGRTANIRNTPELVEKAKEGVTVRVQTTNRSNAPDGGNLLGTERITYQQRQDDFMPSVPEAPIIAQVVPEVQKSSMNWLLPLVILGSFFMASKFKKKKKNG